MARFEPLRLVHHTYGDCFVMQPLDALLLESSRAFRVQRHAKRQPRDGWQKWLLVDSFNRDPAIIHEIWRRTYEMYEADRWGPMR